MWSRFFGAAKVFAVDRMHSRLKRASSYGADVIINPLEEDALEVIKDETDGWGADIVIECSGAPQYMEQAIRAIKLRGKLHNSGTILSIGYQSKGFPEIGWWDLREGVLTVPGDHTRLELQQVMRLLETGRIDLSRSISHRIPLRDVNRGLDLLESREEDVARIVLKT
jgi:threonine dehydrogenase-like Zn-dependent dehydrogenase